MFAAMFENFDKDAFRSDLKNGLRMANSAVNYKDFENIFINALHIRPL